ncbi:hypothetical protein KE336_gp01 [Aeromonas phage 4_D05]|uniref:Holin n=1 Tax=Aeromonas phage 4_D05 TaxID=2588099 RepID=A0A514TU83_9CAUD|nr:hypothetical protein KE336_gp01 [Aeromonas phage 4_D05]QDJ96114.1 hypothetical protein 4D05_001 [Aeromonas phage 4_D05]
MNWMDIGKQAIQMGAPILGGALGGPAGAAVGAMIANQFGVDDPTPGNIMAAIKADPDAAMKLREVELRHQERLIELENDRFRIETADVQDARKVHQHHWMPSALTICLMLMFGCAFGSLIFLSMPEGNRDMVNFMLGQLSGWLSGAVVYWVGSTRASANKDMMRGGK